MTELTLGVIDVPYENAGATPKKKPKRGQGSSRGEPTTTVAVARALEEKYGVMQAFFDAHKRDIEGSMIESVEGALEDLFTGGNATDPFAGVGRSVQADFKTFLMAAEIETMGIPGVPTKAALEGKSSRFKSGNSGGRRPSFVDTGTYELAFQAWFE